MNTPHQSTEAATPAAAAAALRQRAEEEFSSGPASTRQVESLDEANRLLHELRVHQIELQMQNEELRRSQAELDASRARYFDLYDLAPVGYLTVGEPGLILEANLTVASLLGVTRSTLVRQAFSRFILRDDQDLYYRHRQQLLTTGDPQACELRLVKADGTVFWAQSEATAAREADGTPVYRIMLSDVTEKKRLADVQTFLAQTSSGVADQSFFARLAHYLAGALGMDFVCIDRLEGNGLSARTVAVWCDGHFEDNVTYALKDTPCGDVVGKQVCCFPASVVQFFPHDQVLQDLRAESYVGVTLWSHTCQPIGLIAVISRRPLVNRQQAETTLKLVAVRAAGELERLEAEEKVAKALAEKEVLLRELYHRTKNNMMVISSMLSLYAMDDSPPEMKSILKDINSRIRAMALAHSKLYQSKDLSHINLQDYLSELATLLARTYQLPARTISMVVDAKDVVVLLDIAIPCGLVLTELISNALKYAFPQAPEGEIRIRAVQDGSGCITLTVSDNGVGVPPGFDFRRQPSHGLSILQMIVEHQLQGDVQFSSDHGVQCQIRFTPTYSARV